MKSVAPAKLVIIAVVIMLLAAAGWLFTHRPTPPKAPPPDTRPQIRVMTAQPASLPVALRTLGKVAGSAETQLKARVSGTVTAVHVQAGEDVQQGTLLAEIDARDARVALTQREADVAEIRALIAEEQTRHNANLAALEEEKRLVALAERALERQLRLAKTGATSDDRLDAARSALNQSRLALTARQQAIDSHPSRLQQLQARLARAEALLEQTRRDVATAQLQAPFDALVVQLHTAPGDRVQAGSPMMTLVDRQRLEVVSQVPDDWARQIRDAQASGQPVVASVSVAGTPVRLTLSQVAQVADANTGTLKIHFRPEAPGALIYRQTVDVTIGLPAAPGRLALPLSALYGHDRIYTVEAGRLHMHQVRRLGRWFDQGREWIVVEAGDIKAGTKILTTQLPKAIDGLDVVIQDDDA